MTPKTKETTQGKEATPALQIPKTKIFGIEISNRSVITALLTLIALLGGTSLGSGIATNGAEPVENQLIRHSEQLKSVQDTLNRHDKSLDELKQGQQVIRDRLPPK